MSPDRSDRVRSATATWIATIAAGLAMVLSACVVPRQAGRSAEACPGGPPLSMDVCDPAARPFTLAIDNPHYPLAVGDVRTYTGDEDGTALKLTITVLDEVETRVVEDREEADGQVVEISRNVIAQAPDRSACCFGEDVDIDEDGAVTSHHGAWRAEGGNRPGILMPAAAAVGQRHAQEHAPGLAEDHAHIASAVEPVTVSAGTYSDALHVDECAPLEPGHVSPKDYARGVGMVVDAGMGLVEGR